MQTRRVLARLFLSLLTLAVPAVGLTQAFPNRPLRIVVASAPGTILDTIARTMGPEMAKPLGQPIVVENRPGAQNTIGYEFVAKTAPADGYTLLSVLVQDLVIMPLTIKGLRFDPLHDLPPVIGTLEARNVLVSPSAAPWKSLDEMVAYGKANPGKIAAGGSSNLIKLLSQQLLKDQLGLDYLYVPYNNAGAYAQALMASDIQVGIVSISNPTISNPRLRVLAVAGAKRAEALPDTPTFVEQGRADIRPASFSFNVRAGTPAEIVDRLYRVASTALALPEVRGQFQRLKYDVVNESPETAARSLEEQGRIYAEIARKIDLKPE